MMKGCDDLYLKYNVLLLVDAFQKFRNNGLKNYRLCPSHYLNAPALCWDAVLNMTKVEFELIPDPDMCISFDKHTRSGVFYISYRYSNANNKYLKEYDPKQESRHTIYLDPNNLYDYALSNFHPTSGFKWIDPKDFDLNKYTSNISKVYILEVDSKELRQLHNTCPLAPDKREIKREMLSDYKLKIADLYNISIGNVKKIVHNTSCIRIQSIYGKELKNMELKIWKRAEKLLKIEFYSKPVYGDNDKYIKTKTKIHAGSMNTNL